MNKDTLREAILEAERFLKAAKAVKWEKREYPRFSYSETEDRAERWYEDIDHTAAAAAKRASMDLTRALSRMRKPS